MATKLERIIADLPGEQPSVDPWVHPTTVKVDTYAGLVRVAWDTEGAATALGHVPFFVEYLKTAGLFDAWVADCPLDYRSPNAPAARREPHDRRVRTVRCRIGSGADGLEHPASRSEDAAVACGR